MYPVPIDYYPRDRELLLFDDPPTPGGSSKMTIIPLIFAVLIFKMVKTQEMSKDFIDFGVHSINAMVFKSKHDDEKCYDLEKFNFGIHCIEPGGLLSDITHLYKFGYFDGYVA